MSTSTATRRNLDWLRHIVDVAADDSSKAPVDTTFAVLDGLRELIGADWAAFHDLKGSASATELSAGTWKTAPSALTCRAGWGQWGAAFADGEKAGQ